MSDRMNFTKDSIRLMGKDFEYKKDIKNKQIKEYQETIEKEYKKYDPLVEKGEKLDTDMENIESEIESLDLIIDSIMNQALPDDDDLSKITNLAEQRLILFKQRREKVEEIRKFNKKNIKAEKEIIDSIDQKQGEMASLMLKDFKIDEYVDNHDDLDQVIVQNLPTIRKMSLTGVKDKKIKEFIRDTVKNESDNILVNRSPSTGRGRRSGKGFRS